MSNTLRVYGGCTRMASTFASRGQMRDLENIGIHLGSENVTKPTGAWLDLSRRCTLLGVKRHWRMLAGAGLEMQSTSARILTLEKRRIWRLKKTLRN